MKRVTSIYSLLVNQLRNLLLSGNQIQWAAESNIVREHIPVLNLRLVHSVKQPVENADKPERTKLYIKHMVTIRCKIILKSVLENLGIVFTTVELGEAEIIGSISDAKREQLKSELLKYGLELMEDKKIILVEKIKNLIIERIHYSTESPAIKF